jgi:hypothetical protein
VYIDWLAQLPWERRHTRLFVWLRRAAGVVFLVIAAILLGSQSARWWLPALLVGLAAREFYTAYRLPPAIVATKPSADRI